MRRSHVKRLTGPLYFWVPIAILILTNFSGNSVATVVVAHWKKELDRDAMHAALKS